MADTALRAKQRAAEKLARQLDALQKKQGSSSDKLLKRVGGTLCQPGPDLPLQEEVLFTCTAGMSSCQLTAHAQNRAACHSVVGCADWAALRCCNRVLQAQRAEVDCGSLLDELQQLIQAKADVAQQRADLDRCVLTGREAPGQAGISAACQVQGVGWLGTKTAGVHDAVADSPTTCKQGTKPLCCAVVVPFAQDQHAADGGTGAAVRAASRWVSQPGAVAQGLLLLPAAAAVLTHRRSSCSGSLGEEQWHWLCARRLPPPTHIVCTAHPQPFCLPICAGLPCACLIHLSCSVARQRQPLPGRVKGPGDCQAGKGPRRAAAPAGQVPARAAAAVGGSEGGGSAC